MTSAGRGGWWGLGRCEQSPRPGIPIVAGQGEAMPIFVVQLRMIGAVVISGPPRFRPEQRVLHHSLRGQNPVVKLPRPLKLVKVFGAEINEVFLQHA